MKKRSVFLLIVLLILAAVYVASNRFIKTKGYDGLMDFIPSFVSNSLNSAPAQDTLFIKIDKEGYEKFSKIRDEALERGIIVNPENPWVEGRIKYKGEKVKAELRLKGKMTDHVKDHKWSFRVKTKKGELINNMHRFSLQQPGTRNYMYEWVHQTLAKEQGMMALNYQFVHVYLNKEDLGIYALEENFDKELALNNERALGPIFRFDPDAYWEYRLLGISGYSSLKPEYTTFQSAFIDPMRSYSIEDSIQRSYLEEALFLMNSFREGKISASQALNVELFAKKYAILDLVGGYHSVDWSDVKFYYNPIQKKIEPIAYESFSARRIHTLIGFDKFRPEEAYHDDFHTVLFSDSTFYAEYVKYLKIYAEESFMSDFLQANDGALQANIKVLNAEFAYKRFETNTYTYNAKVIRKLLDPEYPIHVFSKQSKDGMELQLGNVSSLPINVMAVKNESETITIHTSVLAPKLSNGFVNYNTLSIQWTDSIKPTHVVYRILGDDIDREAVIFDYEHPETLSLAQEDDYSVYIGSLFEEKGDSLLIKSGKHLIEKTITIPQGMHLIAKTGAKLAFANGAYLIIKGDLDFKGYDDLPIEISNPHFVFLNNSTPSKFSYVVFKNMHVNDKSTFSYPAAIVADQSSLLFKGCVFEDADQDVFYIVNTQLEMNSCTFYDVETAIKTDFSALTLEQINFSQITKNAISIDASQLKGKDLFIKNCKGKGINAEKWSRVDVDNVEIRDSDLGLSIKTGSTLQAKAVKFVENEMDIEAKSKDGYGITKVSLSILQAEKDVKVEKDEESECLLQ